MTSAIAALYRGFYDGVLSRLPEPTAIALGQAALRSLPLDRLSIFRLEDPRLRTTLGGVPLANPLILAAQYYDPRILSRAMGLGFGAVTAKTITVNARPGHPQPNLVRRRTAAGPGLVKLHGFQNPGLDAFVASIAGLPHRVPLIVSVAGESVDDYVRLVRSLAPLGDLVEINISSPNTSWSTPGTSARSSCARCCKRWAAVSPRPVILKLSPDFRDVHERDFFPAGLQAGCPCGLRKPRRIHKPGLSNRPGD